MGACSWEEQPAMSVVSTIRAAEPVQVQELCGKEAGRHLVVDITTCSRTHDSRSTGVQRARRERWNMTETKSSQAIGEIPRGWQGLAQALQKHSIDRHGLRRQDMKIHDTTSKVTTGRSVTPERQEVTGHQEYGV